VNIIFFRKKNHYKLHLCNICSFHNFPALRDTGNPTTSRPRNCQYCRDSRFPFVILWIRPAWTGSVYETGNRKNMRLHSQAGDESALGVLSPRGWSGRVSADRIDSCLDTRTSEAVNLSTLYEWRKSNQHMEQWPVARRWLTVAIDKAFNRF